MSHSGGLLRGSSLPGTASQEEGAWVSLQLCVRADQKNGLLSHIQAVLASKKIPLETP